MKCFETGEAAGRYNRVSMDIWCAQKGQKMVKGRQQVVWRRENRRLAIWS
jgi:hypothetical protein